MSRKPARSTSCYVSCCAASSQAPSIIGTHIVQGKLHSSDLLTFREFWSSWLETGYPKQRLLSLHCSIQPLAGHVLTYPESGFSLVEFSPQ